ncbi:pro convertase subtilisin kexin type 5 isoform X4 [Brachionus plicatilis]|uniref:Pro convertase subtilisin kexin type 5 isoform X4 n=1 Tax=Brachionus plicatilis TaxID=10195 RepID=A0A3M7QJ72_BRAPC|nr:pro convertase subtilisin kexin type 5 isoform X4 [Brachionus plicatilis]
MTTNDANEANSLLKDTGFRILRQVGPLNGVYMVEAEQHRISKRSAHDLHKAARKITSHPRVQLFEREKILTRHKRDFIELPLEMHIEKLGRSADKSANEDPFWSDMWYLNRHNKNPSLFDMNVTGAWSQGYSGKGVSVTFLDDGLEWDHPDIRQNYDPKASADINNHDDDPMPRYEETNENKHGTRCAGEVAAVANNSICSASSLGFNSDHVAIYSASWGPDDNGEVVDGPGPLARRAFVKGVKSGRAGLGSIFVWASGNGGRFQDSCACDGYANSIYTLSISSTSERSEKPWYLEECASTLATTYSSGDERAGEKEIITTDIRHKCTAKHTGTSAAAPIAAGIIALALEANPKLTWRDVMFITALTSRPKAIKSNNYIENKRGLLVSSRYGFGLMDAGRMVEVAKDWISVPPMVSCSIQNSNFQVKTMQKSHVIEAVLTTDACHGTINEVNYIEQVEVIVSVRAQQRGLLEIYLTSPMGTRTQILPQRPRDMSQDGFRKWSFMSVQTWGEFPKGDWTLTIGSSDRSQGKY